MAGRNPVSREARGDASPGGSLDADEALVRRARSGDERAREALGRRMDCVRKLLHHRNRRGGSPFGDSELEDLAQDVLVAAWNKLDRFHYGRLEAWLQRIALFEWLSRLRTRSRSPAPVEDVEALQPASEEDPTNLQLFELERVYKELEDLGPPENHVIRLKLLEELSFPAIARALGESENTVKTWYYRGLRRLRENVARPAHSRTGGVPSEGAR